MRVVADTNVIVSMLFWGKALQPLFELVNNRKVVLCFSPDTIDELFRVVNYPHVRAQAEKSNVPLEVLIDKLVSASEINSLGTRLHILTEDESDNRILEAALANGARYIISGDRHLLKLKQVRNVIICSPSDFLTQYRKAAG